MAAKPLFKSDAVDIFRCYKPISILFPLIPGLSAGFPSPAADFIDLDIDLEKELIRNRPATYFGRIKGDSMEDAGIGDGDLIIVDKSIECSEGNIAVCVLDGEFLVKQVRFEKDIIWLVAANDKYQPRAVTKDNDFVIWAIVTTVIKSVYHVRTR